ncbi:MAG: GGDEF domain-containing protein [Oscillospiraceae bacterium]|nr:GGDEF domain-containing protein [Oscillospiraceae bacterium]
MTREEINLMIVELRRVFDTVRIIEAPTDKQCGINNACEIVHEPGRCFDFWKQESRCKHCVSMRALSKKQLVRKFEFTDSEIYLITAMYVEIENKPFVIEMFAKLTEETMIGAFENNDFVERIGKYNRKFYLDALTGAYNRQYYNEQLAALLGEHAVAYVDLDKFKDINDTWGHHAGDLALKAVVDAMISCVRETDSVVRLGGDEFLLVFRNIPDSIFAMRLENIRSAVNEIVLADFPDMRLSISVGGYYGEGTMEELVKRADELLYDAKTKRNSVSLNFEV